MLPLVRAASAALFWRSRGLERIEKYTWIDGKVAHTAEGVSFGFGSLVAMVRR